MDEFYSHNFMKRHYFWFGLVSLACVGVAGAALGTRAHSSTIAEAVGEDSRTIYIQIDNTLLTGEKFSVWANSSWKALDTSSTQTVKGQNYYTVDLPMSTDIMVIARASAFKAGTTWNGDGVTVNKQSFDIAARGFNVVNLTGLNGENSYYMNVECSILEDVYVTEAPNKRIFLDRGEHYANYGEGYIFVTQGYFFKPTGYVEFQEGKHLAYFDIPVDLLTASGKTFFFSMYQNEYATYKASTNVTALSYDHAKVFHHDTLGVIERKVMYTGDGEAVEGGYREAVYNCVLADINPCDNSTAYKDYIGCGTLEDLETVWHLHRGDRHSLGLANYHLNGSTEYVDGSHGETVITKLRTMYSNSTKGSTFVAAKANEASDTSMVTLTIAGIALGVSAAIFFGIRKRKDNA